MRKRIFGPARFAAAVITVATVGAATAALADGKAAVEFLNPPAAVARNLPFSEAVRHGDTLYLSGQIGARPGELKVVPGGIREEARQVMDNIKAVLARNGLGMDRVVKCTVFLADMSEWATFNEVYRTYFAGRYPARSALGANGLALGARVEVECLAAVDQ